MNKKIIIGLFVLMFSFALVGCNSDITIEEDLNDTEEIKDNEEAINYYYDENIEEDEELSNE